MTIDKNNIPSFVDDSNIGRKDIPYHYHGYAYDPTKIIRFITRSLEAHRKGLKMVPYRNPIHLGKLKEVTGEPVTDFEEKIPDEVIAWRILTQAPGTRGSDPGIGIKERKPSYRELVENEEGSYIRLGWIIDNWVSFQLLGKSIGDKLELTKWFRGRMLSLKPVIEFLGAEKFYWLGSGRNTELSYNKPIKDIPEELYFFRTEEIYVLELNTFEDLYVELGLGPDLRQSYENHINSFINAIRHETIRRAS